MAGRIRTIGFVYFAMSGTNGPIKIGYADNPKRRLAHLQCGNPETLHLLAVIPGTVKSEKQLHRQFRREQIVGEWFAPSEKLVALIQRNWCHDEEEHGPHPLAPKVKHDA